MSWAFKRKFLYIAGIVLFFAVIIGTPVLYWYTHIPPSCSDGIQNQGETSVDRGGPCPLLDPNTLTPISVLWSRSFKVRDGSYSSVAYVENLNREAGIEKIAYRFRLYDSHNVLVADRDGTTYIMPGAVTPILQTGIDTGTREAVRTLFDFLEEPVWKKMSSSVEKITVDNKKVSDLTFLPRISADVKNLDVAPMFDASLVAVIFDPGGNAFAASGTHIDRFPEGSQQNVVFTWPTPFTTPIGRIDILPVGKPKVLSGAQQ